MAAPPVEARVILDAAAHTTHLARHPGRDVGIGEGGSNEVLEFLHPDGAMTPQPIDQDLGTRARLDFDKVMHGQGAVSSSP